MLTRIEGGSFDTLRGDAEARGMLGPVSYYVSGSHEQTANDPFPGGRQDFERAAAAASFDIAVNRDWEVGVTLRSSDGRLDTFDPVRIEPGGLGPNPFGGPFAFDVDWDFGTIFVDGVVTPDWHANLVIGFYREDFDSAFQSDETQRWSLEWENHYEWNHRHTTVAGVSAEETDFNRLAGTAVNRTETLAAVYVHHLWRPAEHLNLSAGVRGEEYDSFGSVETHRLAAVYEFEDSRTRLRAAYGTGFRSPNLVELFGTTSGGDFVGNPALRPEDSRGWEIGVAQPFGHSHEIEVTAFANAIDDAIITPFLPAAPFIGMPFNAPGTQRTRGVEWEARGATMDGLLEYRLSHTFLDRRLQGVPRHVAQGNVQAHPTHDSMVGAGVSYVGRRDYGGQDLDGYFVSRLYGEYHINENLTVHARVENLLDEDYEHARFNFDAPRPGAGFGAFGGVTMRW
ncbi:MAG: TonB-dependent receptor [Akkermansiaceae bacterium]|nr:TonB-dependent receptor [Akkermansiaceae bacterium]